MSHESLEKLDFLTVAEVAKYLRVSKMTVYRLASRGDLEAVRIGRSFRIPSQSVLDYASRAADR